MLVSLRLLSKIADVTSNYYCTKCSNCEQSVESQITEEEITISTITFFFTQFLFLQYTCLIIDFSFVIM